MYAAVFAALLSCEKPDEGQTGGQGGDGGDSGKPTPENVTISPKTHEFKAENELTCVVKVQSSADWTLTPETTSWLTPSATTGKNGASVTFTAKPNTSTEKRGPVTFTFKVGKATATFTAEQLGKSSPEPQPNHTLEFADPSHSNVTVPVEGLTMEKFTLNTTLLPSDLTVEVTYIDDEEKDWILPQYLFIKKELRLNVDPNDGPERKAKVVVKDKNGNAKDLEMLLTQQGVSAPEPTYTLEFKYPGYDNKVVAADGHQELIELNTNIPDNKLQLIAEYTTGGDGWIEFAMNSAIMQSLFGITIHPNDGPERKGKIIVRATDGSVNDLVMNITQEGKPQPEPQPQPEDFAGKTVWVKGLNNIPDPNTWKKMWTVPAPRYGLKWDVSYGWYDCNKIYPNGLNYGPILDGLSGTPDVNLCWAATAANMIHWWLDVNKDNIARYAKYNGPKEYKDSFHSEVFDLFKKNFDDKGYDVNAVLNWFFTGRRIAIGSRPSSAGYFKDVLGEGTIASELFAVDGGRFTQVVKDALAAGKVIGFNHTFKNGSLHAINLWGATFDDSGEITHIYVTDSNNGDYTGQMEGPILTPAGLEKRPVKVKEGTTCMESSNPNDYSLPIVNVYTIDPMKDKWEAYFRTH